MLDVAIDKGGEEDKGFRFDAFRVSAIVEYSAGVEHADESVFLLYLLPASVKKRSVAFSSE